MIKSLAAAAFLSFANAASEWQAGSCPELD